MSATAGSRSAWAGAIISSIAVLAANAAEAPRTPVATTRVAWDCWLGYADFSVIRCIAELTPAREAIDPQDEAAELVLSRTRAFLRAGNARGAEALLEKHGPLLRHGDLWQVPLHAPPHDSSWREGRIERLVRAGLCRGFAQCSVMVVRPSPGASIAG